MGVRQEGAVRAAYVRAKLRECLTVKLCSWRRLSVFCYGCLRLKEFLIVANFLAVVVSQPIGRLLRSSTSVEHQLRTMADFLRVLTICSYTLLYFPRLATFSRMRRAKLSRRYVKRSSKWRDGIEAMPNHST